jgi:hypothetical protein
MVHNFGLILLSNYIAVSEFAKMPHKNIKR